jgi:hypothetical protein
VAVVVLLGSHRKQIGLAPVVLAAAAKVLMETLRAAMELQIPAAEVAVATTD